VTRTGMIFMPNFMKSGQYFKLPGGRHMDGQTNGHRDTMGLYFLKREPILC